MKKLMFSLSLIMVLALVLSACAGTDEQAGTDIDQLDGVEGTSGAMVGETPVDEGFGPGIAATEEVEVAATEEGDLTIPEEPTMAVTEEADLMATEEPLDTDVESTVEPATVEPAEDDSIAGTGDDEAVLPSTGTTNIDHMSNLLDFEVWNRSGEQIGSVNAIVVNQDSADIEYVIVGTGGFLGLAESEIPVPWSALEVQSEASADLAGDEVSDDENRQNVFILNMSQEELEQAPEFDLSPIYDPNNSDAGSFQQLEQDIRSFWPNATMERSSTTDDGMGTDDQTMTQASGNFNLVLADDLLGANVQTASSISELPNTGDTTVEQDPNQTFTADQDVLGDVEEIIVDLDSGTVDYLLVYANVAPIVADEAVPGSVEQPSLDGTGTGDLGATTAPEPELVAVPLQALEWNAEEEVLIYTGSQPFEQAPTISLEDFQSGQTSWQSDVDGFWNQNKNDMMDSENKNQSDSGDGSEDSETTY